MNSTKRSQAQPGPQGPPREKLPTLGASHAEGPGDEVESGSENMWKVCLFYSAVSELNPGYNNLCG